MIYKVRRNQNLIDIAVTNYGSEWIRGLEMIIEHNDVNLADELVPGTELEIKEVNTNDLQLQYLKARGIHVVTGNYTVDVADPTNLVAIAVSETQVDLTWNDNSDNEFGFEVWRATGSGAFALVKTLLPDNESWSDTDVEAGQTYKYKVRANVIFTDVATVTVPFYAPTELTASPVSENSIYLSWTDNSEAETGYEIWRSLDSETYSRIATVYDSFEFTDSDELQPDTTYWYKVRAVNAFSASDFTDEVSAKTFNAFVSVWKTDNAGSSNDNQITLPLLSTGTYAMIVAWGDGQRDLISAYNQPEITHTYASPGSYEVKIYGTIEGFQFNNGGDRRKITAIKKWGDLELGSQVGIFYGCTNLDLSSVIDVLDTSACTTFQDWFRSCSSLTTINRVDEWDTSLNESLRGTFQDSTINDSGLDSWDTSSVTTLLNCFDGASSFNQSLNSWDVSAVVNMQQCFDGANSFNQSLNSWVTTACTNMNAVFNNASTFNGNITSWSANIVTNFGNMFNGSAFNQDISGWNVGSGTNFKGMFANCPFNQDIDGWNVSSATDFANMFLNNTAFDQDLNSWVVTSVTTIASMFRGSSFNSVIGSWTLSSLTEMPRAFEGNTAFNQDISGWDVSKVTTMNACFKDASAFNQDISGWTTTALEDLNATFNGANVFNQDLSGWDVTNLTDAATMFEDSNLSTVNYNALLVGWEGQAFVQNNVVFSGGDAQHSGSGSTARAALIADHTWTITDGGAA